jgi:hypothetical protein
MPGNEDVVLPLVDGVLARIASGSRNDSWSAMCSMTSPQNATSKWRSVSKSLNFGLVKFDAGEINQVIVVGAHADDRAGMPLQFLYRKYVIDITAHAADVDCPPISAITRENLVEVAEGVDCGHVGSRVSASARRLRGCRSAELCLGKSAKEFRYDCREPLTAEPLANLLRQGLIGSGVHRSAGHLNGVSRTDRERRAPSSGRKFAMRRDVGRDHRYANRQRLGHGKSEALGPGASQ